MDYTITGTMNVPEEAKQALEELVSKGDPTEWALAGEKADGSLYLIGTLKKAEDCPQEIFDNATEWLGVLISIHSRQ